MRNKKAQKTPSHENRENTFYVASLEDIGKAREILKIVVSPLNIAFVIVSYDGGCGGFVIEVKSFRNWQGKGRIIRR